MHLNFPELFSVSYVIEWGIRIMMLFIVPKNRKPSSATAWLVLIMIFPLFGLIVFLLIGSPKLSKRRQKIQQTMDRRTIKMFSDLKNNPSFKNNFNNSNPPELARLTNLNQQLSYLPPLKNNKVELIADYQQSFEELIFDINHAKTFVHAEFYIFTYDNETKALFESLDNATKRGVKVRVLFDAIGTRRVKNYRKTLKFLKNSAIEWYKILPIGRPGPGFNRPDLRNHRKIVVVDGSSAYSGSQNIIKRNYHRKDGIYYDELFVKISGPAVVELNAIFASDWYAETGEYLGEELLFNSNIQYSDSSIVQVLPSGPAYHSENNLKLFTSLIHQADYKVVITNPYFVPTDSLMIAITSAAQRGVEVTMINSQVMDQKLVGHAQRSYYEELLKAGVKIFWYKEPILLHSKSISVDNNTAIIGSSNLDMRSLQLNSEVSILIFDKKVLNSLRQIEKRYLENSKEVTLKFWQSRPTRSALLDNLARLTAALQ